jgi:hypothetical protein
MIISSMRAEKWAKQAAAVQTNQHLFHELMHVTDAQNVQWPIEMYMNS